jgi:uncharacterized caspase-like protein
MAKMTAVFRKNLYSWVMVLAMAALVSAGARAAERPRLALVIGVSDYDTLPKLKNPANDADLITASLRDVGFDVMTRTDPSRHALEGVLAEFEARIASAKDPVVAFYYAGQGLQINGENFIIPRDARIEKQDDVADQGVRIAPVLSRFLNANATARFLIFVDACADNPFLRLKETRGLVIIERDRGLAPIETNQRMAVMYATAPGRTALDGAGNNGPFALALAKYLRVPGLEFGEFAKQVRDEVLATTSGFQDPWVQTSLNEPFYFSGAPAVSKEPEADAKTRAMEVFYEPTPGELVATYADGSYALLIGVSNYDDSLKAWRDLPAVRSELDELAKTLETMHGFKVTTVFDATGQQLEKAIKDFVNEHGSKTNARLLFFLSGHGVTIENTLTKKKVGWFVPSDAPHYVNSPIPFANIALNMSRIAEWSEMMEAKHVLWVFDSCFSGVALRMMEKKGDDAINPWEAHLHQKPVRRVITAGSENQEVPAESRFTTQFTRALRGDVKIGDQDTLITGGELGEFLKKDLVDFSFGTDIPQTPQSDTIIIPDIDSGDIVFRIEPELMAGLNP